MKNLLELFNPFKAEYDVEVRLHKSNALIYIFCFLLLVLFFELIRGAESTYYKIVFTLIGFYTLSIAKYFLDTTEKAISDISRHKSEINNLRKEIEGVTAKK